MFACALLIDANMFQAGRHDGGTQTGEFRAFQDHRQMTAAFQPPASFDAIDDDMAAVLRQKTPAERLAISHGMWRSAQSMIHRVVRHQNPDWSAEQVDHEVARRMSHGQSELLRYACVTLDGLRIRYLVTGSQATIAFGEPRVPDVVVRRECGRGARAVPSQLVFGPETPDVLDVAHHDRDVAVGEEVVGVRVEGHPAILAFDGDDQQAVLAMRFGGSHRNAD